MDMEDFKCRNEIGAEIEKEVAERMKRLPISQCAAVDKKNAKDTREGKRR